MSKEQVILEYNPLEDRDLPWLIKFRSPEDHSVWLTEIWCITESEARDAISENNLEVIRKVRPS